MQTLTLANIYELQGLKEEALDIYKEILKKDLVVEQSDSQPQLYDSYPGEFYL